MRIAGFRRAGGFFGFEKAKNVYHEDHEGHEVLEFVKSDGLVEFVELGADDHRQVSVALEAVINQPTTCYPYKVS